MEFLSEPEMVHADASNRMDGTACAVAAGGPGSFCRSPYYRISLNVPWDKEGPGQYCVQFAEAGRWLLLDEILFRRKSPYPKTYDRKYEALLADVSVINRLFLPVLGFRTKRKQNASESPSDYGKLWYGQLWQRPSYGLPDSGFSWMREYHVTVIR